MIKFSPIRPEVIETIQYFAKELDLYDPRFDEKSQCGGYRVFKDLCLMPEFPENIKPDDYNFVGDNRFSGLHVLARQPAYLMAKHCRKLIGEKVHKKIKEDDL